MLKKIFLFLAFFSFLWYNSFCSASTWTAEDTKWELAFQSSLVIDYLQTREIARRPEFYETNVLLGQHPSAGKINAYFASCALGHAYISSLLGGKWRRGWQVVWFGIETYTDIKNYQLGVALTF